MDEQQFRMKSEVVDQPSSASDDLVRSVDQVICERQRFTFSQFLCVFPQILHTVLYEIIAIRVGCNKFCARWIPKIFDGFAQNAENGFGFDIFWQRWRLISQSYRTSNRWWNLGFICGCWNQRAVKAINAHTFTKQMSTCQNADGNCFLD
jgi:hypothetical protein